MRVTFLEHSGFLVELPSVSLLFDWWRGKLPELAEEKPLYVFARHSHPDHFLPAVFALDDGRRDVRFLLGNDIRLNARNLEKWGVSAETAERCQVLKGGQTCALPRANIETLHSTDEGVAFLVSADGQVIFHAGDLNWWHWEGEDKAWNNNMAANFKRYAEPLRGRKIDLAMFPLDARLREAGNSLRCGGFCPCTNGTSSPLRRSFWRPIRSLRNRRSRLRETGRSFNFRDAGKEEGYAV